MQEAKSVNRLKGKAEEQMQDYAVPAVPAGIEEGIEDDAAASISKLYNIPMGNLRELLVLHNYVYYESIQMDYQIYSKQGKQSQNYACW